MQTAQMLKQYKDNRIQSVSGVRVIRVTNYLIDVFTGEGWNSHSRYSKLKGKWVHVSGKKLASDELKQVTDLL